MKNILYVILHTCTRPERYDGVVNTWGQNVDFLFYSDCENEEKKIVKMSDDTSYKSNESKHINVLKYLIEKDYQYEWFFFCDDDTFVNTKNLENNLDSFDPTKITGNLLVGTWNKDLTLSYCSGGAGYLIHKNLLTEIFKVIRITDSNYSDVSLGICAKELNIEFSNHKGFKSQSPEFYEETFSDIKDNFTYHYIAPLGMVEMYQIVNS